VGGPEVAAAAVSVVEMPRLAGFDQLATATAVDSAGGDEWFELSAAGDVGVGVAAGACRLNWRFFLAALMRGAVRQKPGCRADRLSVRSSAGLRPQEVGRSPADPRARPSADRDRAAKDAAENFRP
jgi:hypothetical protein